MNTFSYKLNGNLYINLTNRCSNDCSFCVRNGKSSYYGNELWLDNEPTAEEVLQSIPNEQFNEYVFCGFGEPTFRLNVLLEVAKALKEKGFTTRLNTNGQGNLINGEDITKELAKCIDKVNVSLNTSDKHKYFDVCNSIFGEDAYDELLDFAKLCKKRGMDTCFSIVDCIGESEIAKCKKVAEKCNIPLKIREMIEDS